MKKILGSILTIILTVSVMSGIESIMMPKPANATSNYIPPPPAPSVPDDNPLNVRIQIKEDVPPEPIPPDDDELGQPREVVQTPPTPKSPCLTYNGSRIYPVENASATCQGTIIKSNGQSYNFSCPAVNGISAIYIEYNENYRYPIKIFPFKKQNSDKPLGEWSYNYRNLKIGGIYNLDGKNWKLLKARAEKYDWWPWGVLRTAVSPFYTTTGGYNYWKYDAPTSWFLGLSGNPFTSYSIETGIFEAVDPIVTVRDLNCVYPFKPTVQPLYSVTCLLYYDSAFYQAQSKDTIRSGGSLIGARQGIRAGQTADPALGRANNYGVNIGNHMNCQYDSLRTTESYNVSQPENGGYGYYRLNAQVYATKCFIEGYPMWTQNRTKDRITGCTDPFLYNTYNSYATYSCQGFIRTGQGAGAWAALPNNVNFAVSACEPFVCTFTGTTQIGNTDLPIQVMRNGENIPVRYPTVTIDTAGSPFARPDNGAPNWESVTSAASGVTAGSSPFYGNATNNSKQYFNLRNAEDRSVTFLSARSGDSVNANNSSPASAWQPRLINGAPNPNYSNGFIRFNWASDTSKTWSMFRTFRISGEFYVPIVNGSMGGTSMGWQSEDKYCGNIVSNPVTVVRSVNEVQQ